MSNIPQGSIEVMNEEEIEISLTKIAYEIIEHNYPLDNKVALVGIKTGGEYLAKRLHKIIYDITGVDLEMGFIDIALYRDDLINVVSDPVLNGTEIDFNILEKKLILVDDIFYTGRTIRSALDAIIDFGRPKNVALAVLLDREKGEYPIRPDYYAKKVVNEKKDKMRMLFKERDGKDSIYLLKA